MKSDQGSAVVHHGRVAVAAQPGDAAQPHEFQAGAVGSRDVVGQRERRTIGDTQAPSRTGGRFVADCRRCQPRHGHEQLRQDQGHGTRPHHAAMVPPRAATTATARLERAFRTRPCAPRTPPPGPTRRGSHGSAGSSSCRQGGSRGRAVGAGGSPAEMEAVGRPARPAGSPGVKPPGAGVRPAGWWPSAVAVATVMRVARAAPPARVVRKRADSKNSCPRTGSLARSRNARPATPARRGRAKRGSPQTARRGRRDRAGSRLQWAHSPRSPGTNPTTQAAQPTAARPEQRPERRRSPLRPGRRSAARLRRAVRRDQPAV